MRTLLLVVISAFFISNVNVLAQDNSQRVNPRALYRPPQAKAQKDTLRLSTPVSKSNNKEIDSIRANYNYVIEDTEQQQIGQDTERQKNIQDSILKREAFIRDSILAREAFVRDSILKRQAFVRDSILRKQRMLDSVTQLKSQLEKLIYAGLLSQNESFMVVKGIEIIGDSALGNYEYVLLNQFSNQPYKPWLSTVSINGTGVDFKRDRQQKITAIKTPEVNWVFDYSGDGRILKVIHPPAIAVKYGKNYYKMPFDSVFYERNRIVKIKRYTDMYEANASYQRGRFLFSFLYHVKQFTYKSYDNNISHYQTVDFCEKWELHDANKVCNIVNYDVSKQGNAYSFKKMREPVNEFSDGTLIYEFDGNNNLSAVIFKNLSGTKTTKTDIKLNAKGDVARYIYTVNGVTSNVISINYFYDNPKAKYKYEVITSPYSEDGISYFEKNITTGKSRQRDKLTLEWSPWR